LWSRTTGLRQTVGRGTERQGTRHPRHRRPHQCYRTHRGAGERRPSKIFVSIRFQRGYAPHLETHVREVYKLKFLRHRRKCVSNYVLCYTSHKVLIKVIHLKR
jgi:hypothetical protein